MNDQPNDETNDEIVLSDALQDFLPVDFSVVPGNIRATLGDGVAITLVWEQLEPGIYAPVSLRIGNHYYDLVEAD